MKKPTQKDIILGYLKQNNYLIPAKMANKVVDIWVNGEFGHWFGSELPRKCRLLREEGYLDSSPDPNEPKYERFFLKDKQGRLL